MNRNRIIEEIRKHKVIVILRRVPGEKLLPLAEALTGAGIRLIEVTFDHSAPDYRHTTGEAIARLCAHFPMLSVGAGTVLDAEDVACAAEHGASYIISPDTCAEVIAETRRRGLVSIPGAFTPSEITAAYRLGADFVKVFPSDVGGAAYIRAVKAPLSHIPLLAVGGVDERTIPAFLAAGAEGFGVGSGIVDKKALADGDYAAIAKRAAAFLAAL